MVLFDRVGQLHQHNVIVHGLVVITLVPVNGVHRHVLLCALVNPDVVVAQDGNLRIRAKTKTGSKMLCRIQGEYSQHHNT